MSKGNQICLNAWTIRTQYLQYGTHVATGPNSTFRSACAEGRGATASHTAGSTPRTACTHGYKKPSTPSNRSTNASVHTPGTPIRSTPTTCLSLMVMGATEHRPAFNVWELGPYPSAAPTHDTHSTHGPAARMDQLLRRDAVRQTDSPKPPVRGGCHQTLRLRCRTPHQPYQPRATPQRSPCRPSAHLAPETTTRLQQLTC